MPQRSRRSVIYEEITGTVLVANGALYTFTFTGQILLGIEQANANLEVSDDGSNWISQNLDANAPPYIPGPGTITVTNGRTRLRNDTGLANRLRWAGWRLR